jgi:hypothetical protein
MARITIKGLQAQLAVANQVCADQRARIAELESKLATRGCIATPTQRVHTQRELPAHFAVAREAAMRFGKTVKVVA